MNTIDFHGVNVTHRHHFLSADGLFRPLIEILEEDSIVVKEDGALVRARVGWEVGSLEDQLCQVGYTTPDGGVAYGKMRLGTAFARDGDTVVTLGAYMARLGFQPDGEARFVNDVGRRVVAFWPSGTPDLRFLAGTLAAYPVDKPFRVSLGLPIDPAEHLVAQSLEGSTLATAGARLAFASPFEGVWLKSHFAYRFGQTDEVVPESLQAL